MRIGNGAPARSRAARSVSMPRVMVASDPLTPREWSCTAGVAPSTEMLMARGWASATLRAFFADSDEPLVVRVHRRPVAWHQSTSERKGLNTNGSLLRNRRCSCR
jgi:hypothetical protein